MSFVSLQLNEGFIRGDDFLVKDIRTDDGERHILLGYREPAETSACSDQMVCGWYFKDRQEAVPSTRYCPCLHQER